MGHPMIRAKQDIVETMAVLRWRRRDDAAREDVRADAESRAQFEALALPLLPSLYNTARWLTRDAAEAEDLVQETMVKALGGFAGFEAGTNFKAWAFRILRNTYLTSRSGLAARRTVALEDELEATGEPEAAVERMTPELELMRLSDRAALQRAMEELPGPLLEVVLLCDVEEMKYREIAAVLEVPIGTVMSRISRARAALKENLAAQGVGWSERGQMR
jgi:RNA polymerase sigma-70 factor (ECF subfamily)